jgi:acyl-CoA thioesterase
MGAFVDATAVERRGKRCAARLDPDWFIWGPFGGYLAALTLRALALHRSHRRPATFSCEYLNVGVAGPVDIGVTRVKAGRRAECLSARLTQAGKPLVDARAWFVAEDLVGLTHDHAAMPVVPPPRALIPFTHWHDHDEEAESPIWRHVERRPTHERLGDARKAEWSAWLRLVDWDVGDDPVLEAARALMWLDMAPWNTALMRHDFPLAYVAPTLDLAAQFQAHLYGAEATGEFQLVHVASPVAAAGLLGTNCKLWSETGKLLATGTAQLMCLPKR